MRTKWTAFGQQTPQTWDHFWQGTRSIQTLIRTASDAVSTVTDLASRVGSFIRRETRPTD